MSTIAPAPTVAQTCEAILALLLPHRRAIDSDPAHFEPQLNQLAHFVAAGLPIVFTLPAFPCKSPNPAKVLGHLPDQGERLSLRFLDNLCGQIEELHPAGARMLICSDGHVFADAIGVPDDHVDDYGRVLTAMIAQEGLTRLGQFGLTDIYGNLPYDEKRRLLHDRYAPSREEMRALVKTDDTFRQLYLGITRFLVEDTHDFTGSKTALQRRCRDRAYTVIARSRAWGDLLADHHGVSVRLSIHPQPAGTAKFGIRLVDAADAWTTPWHSCAVRTGEDSWQLQPAAVARANGTVIVRDGRADHVDGR